jgi:hypothetical protein
LIIFRQPGASGDPDDKKAEAAGGGLNVACATVNVKKF